jgi:hypothetical protein
MENAYWTCNNISLPELDESIGHTLVHYLHTGTYQTLKLPGVLGAATKAEEYRRGILAYFAARSYGLDGLAAYAKEAIVKFDGAMSMFETLDIVKELYPKLSDNEMWFSVYLESKIEAAFKSDETLFKQERFLTYIGGPAAFNRALFKSMVEIYTEKILIMEKHALEQILVGETHLEELPASEESSTSENTPAAEEQSASEGAPAPEAHSASEDAPTAEEQSAELTEDASPCEEPVATAPSCEDAIPEPVSSCAVPVSSEAPDSVCGFSFGSVTKKDKKKGKSSSWALAQPDPLPAPEPPIEHCDDFGLPSEPEPVADIEVECPAVCLEQGPECEPAADPWAFWGLPKKSKLEGERKVVESDPEPGDNGGDDVAPKLNINFGETNTPKSSGSGIGIGNWTASLGSGLGSSRGGKSWGFDSGNDNSSKDKVDKSKEDNPWETGKKEKTKDSGPGFDFSFGAYGSSGNAGADPAVEEKKEEKEGKTEEDGLGWSFGAVTKKDKKKGAATFFREPVPEPEPTPEPIAETKIVDGGWDFFFGPTARDKKKKKKGAAIEEPLPAEHIIVPEPASESPKGHNLWVGSGWGAATVVGVIEEKSAELTPPPPPLLAEPVASAPADNSWSTLATTIKKGKKGKKGKEEPVKEPELEPEPVPEPEPAPVEPEPKLAADNWTSSWDLGKKDKKKARKKGVKVKEAKPAPKESEPEPVPEPEPKPVVVLEPEPEPAADDWASAGWGSLGKKDKKKGKKGTKVEEVEPEPQVEPVLEPVPELEPELEPAADDWTSSWGLSKKDKKKAGKKGTKVEEVEPEPQVEPVSELEPELEPAADDWTSSWGLSKKDKKKAGKKGTKVEEVKPEPQVEPVPEPEPEPEPKLVVVALEANPPADDTWGDTGWGTLANKSKKKGSKKAVKEEPKIEEPPPPPSPPPEPEPEFPQAVDVSDVEENSMCSSGATHFKNGMWRNCNRCRAFVRHMFAQLANEGELDMDRYEFVDRRLLN